MDVGTLWLLSAGCELGFIVIIGVILLFILRSAFAEAPLDAVERAEREGHAARYRERLRRMAELAREECKRER